MRMGGGRFEGANPYASMLILQPSNLGRASSPLAASPIIQPSYPAYRVTLILMNSLPDPVACACFLTKPSVEDPVPALTG